MGNFISIFDSKKSDDNNIQNLIMENYNLKSDNEALISQVKSLKKIIVNEGKDSQDESMNT
tara:strand:- start:155 stop:337 length:183 start_codon:yes stop_codon:yes gene_type:complete